MFYVAVKELLYWLRVVNPAILMDDTDRLQVIFTKSKCDADRNVQYELIEIEILSVKEDKRDMSNIIENSLNPVVYT